MSKRRHHEQPPPTTQAAGYYTRVPQDIGDTAAFQNLSSHAAHLLLLFFVTRYRGEQRNGQIVLGQWEAVRMMNAARSTVQKAFAELRDKGFIVPGPGPSGPARNGQATRWALTTHGVGEAPATREFAVWKPSPEHRRKRVKAKKPDRVAVTTGPFGGHPGPCGGQVSADLTVTRSGSTDFTPPNLTATRSHYISYSGSGDYSLADREVSGWDERDGPSPASSHREVVR